MMPSASSRWMRLQQGVEDRPTRLPISATDREASPCRRDRILRSVRSILGRRSLEGAVVVWAIRGNSFSIERLISIYREFLTISSTWLPEKGVHLGPPGRARNPPEPGAFERR